MKSDKEAKIIASVLTIMAIFLLYTSYSSDNVVDRLGFAIIGIWIIYTVFGSYIKTVYYENTKKRWRSKGGVK